MRIYLIGLPGSGKTTLGKELAALLHLQFVDLDDLIIEKEGASIGDVFDQKGEDYFRKVEREVLYASAKLENVVIATGGGTPCFFDNMEFILRNGHSIFLNVPVEAIVSRLMADEKVQSRPLVRGKSTPELQAYMQGVLTKRMPYYLRSELVMEGDALDAAAVAAAIQKK